MLHFLGKSFHPKLQLEIKLKDRVSLVSDKTADPELVRTGRDLHLYNEIVETSQDQNGIVDLHMPQDFIQATTNAVELEMEDLGSTSRR